MVIDRRSFFVPKIGSLVSMPRLFFKHLNAISVLDHSRPTNQFMDIIEINVNDVFIFLGARERFFQDSTFNALNDYYVGLFSLRLSRHVVLVMGKTYFTPENPWISTA